MRAFSVVLLILAQPSLAAECFSVPTSPGQMIGLRGVIEHKPASSSPGSVEIFLNLSTPICVQGVGANGRPFKNRRITFLMVGVPDAVANLVVRLRPRAHLRLRGELLYPTFNARSERIDNVTFMVKEVL
jgi:hypothetical protein